MTSTWTLSLGAEQRAFRLQTATRVLRAGDVRGVRIAGYFSPASVEGFFDPGAVQMMSSPAPYFASDRPLERAYAIGAPGGGSLDVTASGQRETVLRSTAACGNAPDAVFCRSGLEQMLAGSYPRREAGTGPAGRPPRPPTWTPVSSGARTRRSRP